MSPGPWHKMAANPASFAAQALQRGRPRHLGQWLGPGVVRSRNAESVGEGGGDPGMSARVGVEAVGAPQAGVGRNRVGREVDQHRAGPSGDLSQASVEGFDPGRYQVTERHDRTEIGQREREHRGAGRDPMQSWPVILDRGL